MNVLKDLWHCSTTNQRGREIDLAMAGQFQMVPAHLSGDNTYSTNHTTLAQTCHGLSRFHAFICDVPLTRYFSSLTSNLLYLPDNP